MTERRIDEDVQAFLRQHIESYEHLEVLFLLHGQRHDAWSSEAVADKLGITVEVARETTHHLAGSGLLEFQPSGSGPAFRYRPASAYLESRVDRLVQTYEENRLGVILLMNSSAIDRVRSAAIRTFAEAFRLRKEKDEE